MGVFLLAHHILTVVTNLRTDSNVKFASLELDLPLIALHKLLSNVINNVKRFLNSANTKTADASIQCNSVDKDCMNCNPPRLTLPKPVASATSAAAAVERGGGGSG